MQSAEDSQFRGWCNCRLEARSASADGPARRFDPENPSLWGRLCIGCLSRTAKSRRRLSSPARIHEHEWNLDKDRLELARGEEINSHRRAASRVRNVRFALAVGSVRETRAYIVFREIRKFMQNVSVRHSAGQILQNVIHGNPESAK